LHLRNHALGVLLDTHFHKTMESFCGATFCGQAARPPENVVQYDLWPPMAVRRKTPQ
jgi:hypothetical protein